jgi:hypothetical protein
MVEASNQEKIKALLTSIATNGQPPLYIIVIYALLTVQLVAVAIILNRLSSVPLSTLLLEVMK